MLLTNDSRKMKMAETGVESQFRPKNGRYNNDERTADRENYSHSKLSSSSFDSRRSEQRLRAFPGAARRGGWLAEGQPSGIDGDGFCDGRIRECERARAASAHALRVEGAEGGGPEDAARQSGVPAVFANGGRERPFGGFLWGATHRRDQWNLQERAGAGLEIFHRRAGALDEAGADRDVRGGGPGERNRTHGPRGDRDVPGGHDLPGGEHPFPDRLGAVAGRGRDAFAGHEIDPQGRASPTDA